MSDANSSTAAAHVFYIIAWIALIIGIVLWLTGFFSQDKAQETIGLARGSFFVLVALTFAFFVLITFGYAAWRKELCSTM